MAYESGVYVAKEYRGLEEQYGKKIPGRLQNSRRTRTAKKEAK